jgi:hypothetical protein
MAKFRLDTEDMEDDFFEETRLFGIIASIKNYQFCWQLNNITGYNFRLDPEKEIQLKKKNRDYFFSIYACNEPANSVTHYLYHNQFDGEYLLPEFRHMDFLWLMKGNIYDEERCSWLMQAVRQINGVQMVAEITNEKIRNKENMIF